jgi:hypothetical protein
MIAVRRLLLYEYCSVLRCRSRRLDDRLVWLVYIAPFFHLSCTAIPISTRTVGTDNPRSAVTKAWTTAWTQVNAASTKPVENQCNGVRSGGLITLTLATEGKRSVKVPVASCAGRRRASRGVDASGNARTGFISSSGRPGERGREEAAQRLAQFEVGKGTAGQLTETEQRGRIGSPESVRQNHRPTSASAFQLPANAPGCQRRRRVAPQLLCSHTTWSVALLHDLACCFLLYLVQPCSV